MPMVGQCLPGTFFRSSLCFAAVFQLFKKYVFLKRILTEERALVQIHNDKYLRKAKQKAIKSISLYQNRARIFPGQLGGGFQDFPGLLSLPGIVPRRFKLRIEEWPNERR
ncbi:hypothetical protein CEXT_524671 [Caerostris extrusa]|uniref:Uncharacterized protein n=1 Tax=Caerostris extrusa TaxID=172846 RepID=A0AAV4SMP7_CAEEX|nr:hypothetical protein CEXT_524671 [Caerostris extrusa]